MYSTRADPASPPSPAPTRPPERRGKRTDRDRAKGDLLSPFSTVAGRRGKGRRESELLKPDAVVH